MGKERSDCELGVNQHTAIGHHFPVEYTESISNLQRPAARS